MCVEIFGTAALPFVVLFPATLFRFQPLISVFVVIGLVVWMNLHTIEVILNKYRIISLKKYKTEGELKFEEWMSAKKQKESEKIESNFKNNELRKNDLLENHDKPKNLFWLFLYWMFKNGIWVILLLLLLISYLYNSFQNLSSPIPASAVAVANATTTLPATKMLGQNFTYTTTFNK